MSLPGILTKVIMVVGPTLIFLWVISLIWKPFIMPLVDLVMGRKKEKPQDEIEAKKKELELAKIEAEIRKVKGE